MENELGVYRGVVFSYDDVKKFGFINVTHKLCGDDFVLVKEKIDQVFVHRMAIEPEKDCYKKLVCDQAVQFILFKRERGLASKDVIILGDGNKIEEFKNFTRYGSKSKLKNNDEENFNKKEYNKSGNIYE